MNLSSTKEFPFSMETAWAALHKPAMLDVEPGSEVKVIQTQSGKPITARRRQRRYTRRHLTRGAER